MRRYENEGASRKKGVPLKFIILPLILLIVISGLGYMLISHYFRISVTNKINDELQMNGYVPVRLSMDLLGYREENDYFFVNTSETHEITIHFDIEAGVCKKNLYSFPIANSIHISEDSLYIKKDKLESIVNHSVYYAEGILTAEKREYAQHEWTEAFVPLIAHAGGGMREETYNITYTNALEAIIQNYTLGHRIFEMDFYLTSDNHLAAIHDWTSQGKQDGIAMTAEEWKSFGAGKNLDAYLRYSAILLEDVLDQMLINKDLFLVTDTKSVEIPEEEMVKQFQIIYEEAMRRDPELLSRIIPQIYNPEMHDVITKIYPFQSIIFTLYATEITNDEVIAFVAQHDDIKVVTTKGYEDRLDEDFINRLTENGKLIYCHTHNNYSDFTKLLSKGVDGIYTDFLTPKDFEIYEKIAKQD